MTEGTNMICPSCGAFQPRAEVCNKCGIVIAKAPAPAAATSAPQRKAVAAQDNKSPVVRIVLIAVVVIAIAGYFIFSGPNSENQSSTASNDASQTKPAQKKSEIDRIGTFNSAAASNMHRTNVLSKLSTIRNALNMYGVDGNQPPSNDDGLQLLVDKGLLSPSDLTDDWGNTFVYKLKNQRDPATGKDYTISLSSKGPDGIAGNADDISP